MVLWFLFWVQPDTHMPPDSLLPNYILATVSLRIDLLLTQGTGSAGVRVALRERRVSGRAGRHSVVILIATHQ